MLHFYGSTFQPPVGLLCGAQKQTFLRGVSCADFPNNAHNIEAGDSASAELHGPTGFLVFAQAKENVCVYGVSFDTFFNNSGIAIRKLLHGTCSSQQKEQFES